MHIFQDKYICKEPVIDKAEQIVQINFMTLCEPIFFKEAVVEEKLKKDSKWILNKKWTFENLKLFSRNYDPNSYLMIYFTYDKLLEN